MAQIGKHKAFCYYGGKNLLMTNILSIIPPHTVYCEPFAGGASVFWAKAPARLSILNDTNLSLYCFYKVGKENPDALIKRLDSIPYHAESYRRASDIYRNPEGHDELTIAASFFVSIMQSFGGNAASGFGRCWDGKSPVSRKYANAIDALPELLKKLRGVQIDNMDGVELIRRLNAKGKDAWLFVDPPYYNSNMGHYGGYTEADFVKLLEVLSDSPHHFCLTCYPNPHVENRGWNISKVETSNSIKSYTKMPAKKTELIITNYQPPNQLLL